MALALMGLLDLSIVTDELIDRLKLCRDNSELWNQTPQFTINVTGSAPEAVRGDGDCQLNLYLFHIAKDPFLQNSPLTPPRLPPPFPLNPRAETQVPVTPFHPLSLDLYYLLTAYADKDYVREQQAMSIALKCFHENPFIRKTVAIGAANVPEEFSLTMHVESTDELSRFWQSTTSAARLSVVYKVSVVFITPEEPTTAIAPAVKRISLAADPVSLPFANDGQVIGTLRNVSYRSPDLAIVPQPDMRAFDQSPATVAAAERLYLFGAGLNQTTSGRVFLLMADGSAEYEVTSWKVPDPIPPAPKLQTSSRITLDLPATVGALPVNPGDPMTSTPPAGVYQLRVGNATYRSNATPFSVAARLTLPAGPPPPPILTPAAGLYTINGAGLIGGATEVLIGTVRLEEVAGPPAAGEFDVNATGEAITFRLPANIPVGLHTVRIRVNHVESAPTWWIQV